MTRHPNIYCPRCAAFDFAAHDHEAPAKQVAVVPIRCGQCGCDYMTLARFRSHECMPRVSVHMLEAQIAALTKRLDDFEKTQMLFNERVRWMWQDLK
jgi:hypothetical protein